jgi:hypothetical protein
LPFSVIGHVTLACHRYVKEVQTAAAVKEIECRSNVGSRTASKASNNNDFLKSLNSPDANSRQSFAQKDILDVNDSISTHHFRIHHTMLPDFIPKGNHAWTIVQASTKGKFIVAILLALTMAFILLSTLINTVNFDVLGLTGLLMGDSAHSEYGFVTIGTHAPYGGGENPNDPPIRMMEACYLLFGLIMPLMLIVLLSIAWFVPFNKFVHKQMAVYAEVLNAWSALDVFLVAVTACLLEIRQVNVFSF